MLVRMLAFVVVVAVAAGAVLLLLRAQVVVRERGRRTDEPSGSPPGGGAGRRHTEALARAREQLQHAEAAHARALAAAEERLAAAQEAPPGPGRERLLSEARAHLDRTRADTEEVDRARMTLEDLEGAGPLRGDLPQAPDEDDPDDG